MATQAQYTKGPWDVGPNCKTIRPTAAVIAPHRGQVNGGCIVAELFGDDHAANARLIAAAPELLEALIAARPFLEDEALKYDDDGSNEPLEALRQMDAALAKATQA